MTAQWFPVVMVVMAIALAVGPVMMMRPSPRQARLAKLRTEAAQLGLTVHLPKWPKAHTQLAPVKAPDGAIRYLLPWQSPSTEIKPALLIRSSYTHELHVNGIWQWVQQPEQPDQSSLLETWVKEAAIPASVCAIGLSRAGVYVDWTESSQWSLSKLLAMLESMRVRLGAKEEHQREEE
ncbi:hypothetical protein [Marinibactrum halimedae]|uniref:Preprotein translocase subunit YajC n=1 Tax=Marinibactrum halimedae TaxID=1444977 RepID=A0AA37WNC3_9GAMM|nr:hypothetical protein [Marinibactrum halimedae]MCD9459204.1 hypothetical protein [Marinibactrum halimedae]GLS27275.1 hypothetical protein GCM10007877_29940 [Marinibactrum halimedae]